MKSDELILMGKVAGTHGIRGQLRVIPYSGMADNLLSCKFLLLRDAKGRLDKYEVASAVTHSKKLLLTLKGFAGINEVQHFSGCEVLLYKEQLSEPEEDEYYWHDLIGIKVVTIDGTDLGVLDSIIETGSNDVYVAVSEGREFLIPALSDTVSIDMKAKIMTVTPFEGLFDL
jgi:16S rRNA processing protein RimM